MNRQIWLDQLKFNKAFFKSMGKDVSSLSAQEKISWAKEFYFHMNKEMIDLINCFPNWKMHYRHIENETEFISSNLIEEYVDVFKYFMGLGQILGIDYKDIVKGYKEKTEVVKQKYAQNNKIDQLKKKEVVIFDIDGVINNFPICFLDWLKKKKFLNYSSVEELKSKIDLKTYEHLKTEYRTSGVKRNLPVNLETLRLMHVLKDRGEKIVLFTNRPVSKYRVIYGDTLYWLHKNKIPFDAIYWSDYQQKEDIYKFDLKIKFIVEDNLDNSKLFNHEKYLVFLLNKTYNQDINYKNKLLVRICGSPLDILDYDLQKNRWKT